MDPEKVSAVKYWGIPRTRKQLQSFLGFANFYRPLIPHFASITVLLTDLLKTKGKDPKLKVPSAALAWTPKCTEAFNHLKSLFTSDSVLAHPDETCQFIVQVDASDVAMGAVLLQQNGNKQLHPCAYLSKKFTDTERNWLVWEKEVVAIKLALLTWRHLHMRWAELFSRFHFTLHHLPGRQNFLVDVLPTFPSMIAFVNDPLSPFLHHPIWGALLSPGV